MNEEPSRLSMLHFARRIAVQQVDQIDAWIAAEEQREAERQAAESRRAAAEPQWTIGLTTDGRPQEVHAPDCRMAGQRRRDRITVDQAREALVQGVDACQFCRPDTELDL
ncbi:hypothetical protein IFE09_11425 [Streptomyces microflavus]|nr:DUF6233 domain-containing protein [Streptomyces microflavus]QQZ54166.1 hypothetical protein IFE09_11425 [Streptomyces microflavus]